VLKEVVTIRRIVYIIIAAVVAFTVLGYATAGCVRLGRSRTISTSTYVPTVVRLCVHRTPVWPTTTPTPTPGTDPSDIHALVCATPTP
jgi:hypothetical protein